MMQLIDANALREYFKINEHCEDCFFNNNGHCFDKAAYTLHDVCTTIDDIDVIDAIPLDWLRDKMQKPRVTVANPFGYVLAEWLEEQEAR